MDYSLKWSRYPSASSRMFTPDFIRCSVLDLEPIGPLTIHTMLGWSGHHPWDTRTENLCPTSHLGQTTKLGSPTALQTGGNQNPHNQPQPCPTILNHPQPTSTILNQQTFPASHTHPAPRRQISSMELQASHCPLRSPLGSQKRWALVADHWRWWKLIGDVKDILDMQM